MLTCPSRGSGQNVYHIILTVGVVGKSDPSRDTARVDIKCDERSEVRRAALIENLYGQG